MSLKRHPEVIIRCAFCNKDDDDVKKMVAGPTVFICDECIARCQEIVNQNDREAPSEMPDLSEDAKCLIAWFSAHSAWRDDQAEMQRTYARRFGMDRYFLRYLGLKRRQALLLRWFAALVRIPPAVVDEYSPEADGRRWCYTRGHERLYRQRQAVFDRQAYQIVITDPNGIESVENFSDIVQALDRERELDRLFAEEGWQKADAC